MYRIPIAIFKDADSANYGAVIPDVPGCYPVGDTIEELIDDSKSMIIAYMEYITEEKIPFEFRITDIEILRTNTDYESALWALVDIEESAISTKKMRFNVSLPEYLLTKIDAAAKAEHETRSGYIAKAVVGRMDSTSSVR